MTSAVIPTFMICASIWPKPACRLRRPAPLRDQDSGRTHERIDDIAHPQRELLHSPAHAGTNNRLVQIHFGLGQCGFGAGLLGRKNGRDPLHSGLLCGRCGSDRTQATFYKNLKLLNLAERDVTRIATLQLVLGFQFVHRLLVSTLGLLNLPVSLQDIQPRHHEFRFDLGNFAARGLRSGLLPRSCPA